MSKDRVRTITLLASAVIAARRFVAIGASGVAQAGAAADAHGVAGTAAAAIGDPVDVELLDGARTELEAGAAVVAGAEIASDATGRAITAVATNPILGVAVTAAGAAGEIIDVVVSKGAGVA